jgi:hypothetical protein
VRASREPWKPAEPKHREAESPSFRYAKRRPRPLRQSVANLHVHGGDLARRRALRRVSEAAEGNSAGSESARAGRLEILRSRSEEGAGNPLVRPELR